MLRGDWIVNAEVVMLANLEFIFYPTIWIVMNYGMVGGVERMSMAIIIITVIVYT